MLGCGFDSNADFPGITSNTPFFLLVKIFTHQIRKKWKIVSKGLESWAGKCIDELLWPSLKR